MIATIETICFLIDFSYNKRLESDGLTTKNFRLVYSPNLNAILII